MHEPSNSQLLEEIAGLRRTVETLVRNLPALAKLTADGELRREREGFEKRRKEAIGRKVARMWEHPAAPVGAGERGR